MDTFLDCLVHVCRGEKRVPVKKPVKPSAQLEAAVGICRKELGKETLEEIFEASEEPETLEEIFETPEKSQPSSERRETVDLTAPLPVVDLTTEPKKKRRRSKSTVDLTEPPQKRLRSEVPESLGSKDSPVLIEEEVRKPPPPSAEAVPVSESLSPDEFNWTQAPVLLEDGSDQTPVKLSYQQMVRQIELNWPTKFAQRSLGAWYQAVRRWCLRNGLTLRKSNYSEPENPEVVAAQIRKFRELVKQIVNGRNLKPFQILNLDETSVQIFCDLVRTLHYKGSKRVPGQKSGKRLYLNVTIVWWADGKMDFVVVYQSDSEAVKVKPEWQKLGEGAGVYWLKAPSKWTTKVTYPEVLRALLKLNSCGLFTDDHAPCHDGNVPDNFLKSMGGARAQIPRNATALVQPGDRPGCNQHFKRILREVIQQMRLRALLEQDFRNTEMKASLNESTRKIISNVLVQVRTRMNANHSDDIKKAFMETFHPEGSMHETLREFLESHKDEPPQNVEDRDRYFCANGCGWSYLTKKSAVKHAMSLSCWQTRPRLLQPLLRCSLKTLNADFVPGFVVETLGVVVPRNGKYFRSKMRIFTGNNGHFDLDSGVDLTMGGNKKWWHRVGKLRWRAATKEEKALAKKEGWV
jgi:hypothetical protein